MPVIRTLGILTVSLKLCLSASSAIGQDSNNPTDHLLAESVVLNFMIEAELAAQESGIVTKVDVVDGQSVKQGQRIVQIDDRVIRVAKEAAILELQVAAAEAENEISRKYASKAHEVAVAELARSEETNRKYPGSVSQSQLDVERLTVEKTNLEEQQASHDQDIKALQKAVKEHQVSATQLQIDRRRVTSPFAGTVAETFTKPGEWVEPGQKVARVVSVRRLKAEGFLPARLADPKLIGSRVSVRRLTNENRDDKQSNPTSRQSEVSSSATTEGILRYISPDMDPIDARVRIWAEIDNRQQLFRPGEQVEMSIIDHEPTHGGR